MTQSTAIAKQENRGLGLVEEGNFGRNSLAKMSMRDLKELAGVFIESGSFTDVKGAAQAMVKIIAGQELGFSPIVAMTGIHFFNGKVSLGANLIASLIKDSGKYEYKITEHTADACSVVFYQNINGEIKQLGVPVRYTFADATKAGLTGKDNWKKYPMDMLFAACIRQGARRYCADILRGVTPETDVAGESDVDRTAMEVEPVVEASAADDTAIDVEVIETSEPDKAESKSADLMIAIGDLFSSKLGGDADEIAKALGGQDLSQMSLAGLEKLHGDLVAM